MSPLSNSVYSSVFMYNPYVLTRPYWHLTFMASIEPHCISCVLHDISILIMWFGDRARVCGMDASTSRQKWTRRYSLTNYPMTKRQTMDYKYRDSWEGLGEKNCQQSNALLARVTAHALLLLLALPHDFIKHTGLNLCVRYVIQGLASRGSFLTLVLFKY